MKQFAIAILLAAIVATTGTVTMTFAARIGVNDTLHANGTDYPTNYTADFGPLRYALVNSTSTIAAIVSDVQSNAFVNGTYYRETINGTLITLHLDNSTFDANGLKNGTIQGNVTCNSTGKINGACDFSGGRINFSLLDIQGQRNYTLSAWVKTVVDGGVFSQSDENGNHVIALQVTGGTARFATFEGGAGNINDNTAIADNTWHHIAAVKSGTTGYLYVDGSLRSSGTVALVFSTTSAHLGAMHNGTSALSGMIDEFVAWNRSLNSVQINELYESDPRYKLMQLQGNTLFIAVTNGTYSDIDSKISAHSEFASSFGRFIAYTPQSFTMFMRLEYKDIDIRNKIQWSGTGRLLIKNNGLNDRGLPIITMETIR